MKLKNVIKGPVITEKSMQEAALGKYTFRVDSLATKADIRQAVEKFFGVHVSKVRTINVKGKTRWTRGYSRKTKLPGWKKAIVTLKKGEKIETFEAGG